MADVFISYARPDRLIAERLAAELEANGWSVWFDRSLTAGDTYRDVILRELTAARAVVVLWTAASVESEWVRAEAGRAKALDKLLPVKTGDVGYDRIPLPFGEMHTEAVENVEIIRAVVRSMLTRPAAKPSLLGQAGATIRADILLWFGVIGSSLTLFSSLKALVTLSELATLIVSQWQVLTGGFWNGLAGPFSLRLPPHYVAVLNFLVFMTAIAIRGYRSQVGAALPLRKTIVGTALGAAGLAAVWGGYLIFAASSASQPVIRLMDELWKTRQLVAYGSAAAVIYAVFVTPIGVAAALPFVRQRRDILSGIFAGGAYTVMLTCLFALPTVGAGPVSPGSDPIYAGLLALTYLVGLPLLFAAATVGGSARQLSFILIGVAALYGLSGLSAVVARWI